MKRRMRFFTALRYVLRRARVKSSERLSRSWAVDYAHMWVGGFRTHARVLAATCCCATWLGSDGGARAQEPPAPAAELEMKFERTLQEISTRVNGAVGYEVLDLTSGERIGRLDRSVFPTA